MCCIHPWEDTTNRGILPSNVNQLKYFFRYLALWNNFFYRLFKLAHIIQPLKLAYVEVDVQNLCSSRVLKCCHGAVFAPTYRRKVAATLASPVTASRGPSCALGTRRTSRSILRRKSMLSSSRGKTIQTL